MNSETLSHRPPSPAPATLAAPHCIDQVHLWLGEAIEWSRARRATDLHFFPMREDAALWVRIDGDLGEAARYPLSFHERMVARLKVMGRCTDYDGELVLEGRFSLDGDGAGGEARLSILPTLRGDKAVVRLMGGRDRLMQLDELGWPEPAMHTMRSALESPQGLILTVGPSGSGKSTALYAMLADLDAHSGRPVSAVTIEDPVEVALPFAAQVTAHPGRGLDFASGLRAILRHDPEVIMIGEIRDAETAATALQAAMTGHRLLSSMHTLTAAEALLRLQQMGAPSYVIASALGGVLNVRLARRLCPQCRTKRPMTNDEKTMFPESARWPEQSVHDSKGCEVCLGTGHQGRTGLAEWLTVTPETATALQASEPTGALARTMRIGVAAREGALAHLKNGAISPDEWRRIPGMASLEAPGDGAQG